jgi:hypothetical protein
MRSAIYTFEQNSIHHGAEFRNVIHNLDLPLVAQLRRVLVNAIPALLDVRTASLVSSHHSHPGDILGVRGIIEDSRELDNVGGIRADDPNASSLA